MSTTDKKIREFYQKLNNRIKHLEEDMRSIEDRQSIVYTSCYNQHKILGFILTDFESDFADEIFPRVWVLKDSHGNIISAGDEVTDFRAERHIVVSFEPPHKPSSSGRVYIRSTEYPDSHGHGVYPSVIDCRFVEVIEVS